MESPISLNKALLTLKCLNANETDNTAAKKPQILESIADLDKHKHVLTSEQKAVNMLHRGREYDLFQTGKEKLWNPSKPGNQESQYPRDYWKVIFFFSPRNKAKA